MHGRTTYGINIKDGNDSGKKMCTMEQRCAIIDSTTSVVSTSRLLLLLLMIRFLPSVRRERR
jgi:hypothetical protein